jgi:hypothetical protein
MAGIADGYLRHFQDAQSMTAMAMCPHVGRHDLDSGPGLRRLYGLLRLSDHQQAGNPESIGRPLPSLP